MKEKANNTHLVIVLTEHPILGLFLTPYTAEKSADGTIHLAEQAFHSSPEAISCMSQTEQRAIDIASHYTEKYLMGIYSREKTVSRFLHKLSEDPERVKNTIRPYIEKKLLEMLNLIRYHQLPFYQKQPRSKLLYSHHAYNVHPANVEMRFSFYTDEKTFQYRLDCFYEGQPLNISEQKPAIALTSSPATLTLGMDLYFFPNIDSSRILPFTKKDAIVVSALQLDKYIDNIVIPIAHYHEITSRGLKFIEDKRECEAYLALEESICEDPLLKLSYVYTDYTIVPDNSDKMRKVIYKYEDNKILFFKRDYPLEEQKMQLLEDSGLQRISDSHFRLSPTAPESTMTEWINNHREILQHSFRLTGNNSNIPYCLDEIKIEQSYESGLDWFELHITVVIGQFRIPFSRFRRHILEDRKEYMLPNGEMILLPEEWFNKYKNLVELGTQTETGIKIKKTFIGAVQLSPEEHINMHLQTLGEIPNIPAPPTLKAQLRPYQQKGFSWLVSLNTQNFGGCLADDMGLGKTLQTLTLLQYIYKPNLPEKTISLEETTTNNFSNNLSNADVDGQFSLFSLTSEKELLSAPHEIIESYRAKKALSIDKSASNIVIPATLIVVPTSLLHNWRKEAKRFTTLSTAEYNSNTYFPKNHPESFFRQYNLIFTSYGMMRNNIDILSNYTFEYIVLDESQNIKNTDSLTFQTAIQLKSKHKLTLTGTPIENSLKDLWAQFRFLQPDLLGDESDFQKQFIVPIRQGNVRIEKKLRQLISPFILRRSKREVAPELPPLTEEIIYCDMLEKQRQCYTEEKNSLRNALLQYPVNKEKVNALNILNGILRLRQLACHPHLVYPDFTEYSGKTEQIIETFDTLRSEGHKVLIFSSFVKHLEILADIFKLRKWKYALLTGTTNNRPSEIAHFTEENDVQAFLISLKAGGVGLNLTQADYVFIIDPWWNPAAEAQAIARAHRIGQNKQVIAYRFITQNSIEEKILQLQEEKKMLAETFITDSNGLPELSNGQWADLLD